MDNADYHPKLLPLILEGSLLSDDPLVLVDVGCGMGPDPLWRLFGNALRMYGFDANVDEIERLTAVEESAGVQYRAALVGLPEGHEFLVQRNAERGERALEYFNAWERTSTVQALERAWDSGDRSLAEANAWAQARLATEKIGLDEFVAEEGIRSVDFVKVDTDGNDLEVLLSGERMLGDTQVLGLLVETPFTGGASGTANSFHNIDRLLKGYGFILYSLTVNRYSRGALPAPFAHRMYAQTEWGQAMWGDALYLRDAAAPTYREAGGPELTPQKLLKLACLYELFRLPDCAAELLLAFRPRLESLVDIDRALDLLAPPLDGEVVGYTDYVAAFEADQSSFFPADPAETEPPGPAPANDAAVQDLVPSVGGAARLLAYRVGVVVWSRTPELVRAPLRSAVRAVAHRL